MNLNIILNRDNKNNIGIDGELIYHIKEDLEWFKETTIGHIVIMGYNTWVSLPKKPLNKRINIVISNNHYDELKNCEHKPHFVYNSFLECLERIHITNKKDIKIKRDTLDLKSFKKLIIEDIKNNIYEVTTNILNKFDTFNQFDNINTVLIENKNC